MKKTIIDLTIKTIAKDWKEYGTPNKSQCEKIALDAILKYQELSTNEERKIVNFNKV